MSWNLYDPQANTNYTTEQASTFSTRTVPHKFSYGISVSRNANGHNSMTAQASPFFTKTVEHNFTYVTKFPSYPPSPYIVPSLPSIATPTGNYKPHSNPT